MRQPWHNPPTMRDEIMETLVRLHAGAPEKPPLGSPCNGCGICCAAETCPAARMVLFRMRGPCPALEWNEARQRYFCGLVSRPGDHLSWLPGFLAAPASRFFSRLISANAGCDADAQVFD